MIRGTKLHREAAQKINIDVEMGIHNRFDIEVIRANTGELRQKAVGYNIICDQLWNRLLTPATYFNYIHYGTGTGTPTASDTQLFTFLGYGTPKVDDDEYYFNENTGIGYFRRKIQIAPETAVGETITEVGIAFGSAASNLCTHAMMQDMNGNPVSIIKTDTDLINIYATVYCHFNPDGYMNGSVFLSGRNYSKSFIRSICGLYEADSWPRYSFATIGWGMLNRGSKINNSKDKTDTTIVYDKPAKRMIVTVGRHGVNNSNFPVRQLVVLGEFLSYSSGTTVSCPCIQLISGVNNGWLPPCHITGESLGTGDGTTTQFDTAFPFATNATVYVDGATMTEGVIVTPGLNTCAYPSVYISAIKERSTPSNILPSSYDIGTDRNLTTEEDCHYANTYEWMYYYNPCYDTSPITKLTCYYGIVEASLDMENWESVYTFPARATVDCPMQFRNYPFWRLKRTQDYIVSTNSYYTNHNGCFHMEPTGCNVIFATPPAPGSVITIDYTTSVIPKDANHVLDATITIQFGEYTED